MFLRSRLLSARRRGTGPLLAAVTFALGLGIGATIGAGRRRAAAAPSRAASCRDAGGRFHPAAAHPVEVLRVLDGDTFEARVHLWPGLDITTRVRLRGIDAPELKARCRKSAPQGRDRARRAAPISIRARSASRVSTLDKYGGRVVADASTRATPDVATALLDAGSARRYSGGTAR